MSINKKQWLDIVQNWKNKWKNIILPEFEDDTNGINLYKFMEILNNNLKDDSCIVSDAGSVMYCVGQSMEIKKSRRWINDSGQASMGAALPMSIGVCLARNKEETICITGDGSFQTNIQELATIRYLNIPIKIFVWNNSGYLSIRNSQKTFYGNRLFGTGVEHGLWFPKFEDVAKTYEFEFIKINYIKELDFGIKQALNVNKPTIIEIRCNPNQKIVPNLAMKDSKPQPLSNMFPFLSEEEYNNEMIKD